jgi:hypothetical protein
MSIDNEVVFAVIKAHILNTWTDIVAAADRILRDDSRPYLVCHFVTYLGKAPKEFEPDGFPVLWSFAIVVSEDRSPLVYWCDDEQGVYERLAAPYGGKYVYGKHSFPVSRPQYIEVDWLTGNQVEAAQHDISFYTAKYVPSI